MKPQEMLMGLEFRVWTGPGLSKGGEWMRSDSKPVLVAREASQLDCRGQDLRGASLELGFFLRKLGGYLFWGHLMKIRIGILVVEGTSETPNSEPVPAYTPPPAVLPVLCGKARVPANRKSRQ